MSLGVEIDLNAVIVAVTDAQPRILVLEGSTAPTLPFGSFDPLADRTLELGLRAWVVEHTGLELGYTEQLYTFGDRDRYRAANPSSPRALSVAYLALVREQEQTAAADSSAHWRDVYDFLPWEDRRPGGRTAAASLIPRLEDWMKLETGPQAERRERVEITFGGSAVGWDGDRVLDRYELLYEAGLVREAQVDAQSWSTHDGQETERMPSDNTLGHQMDLDHRRIVATALGRLRGKIRYRPVVFELLPPAFTLFQVQRVVEALSGIPLHKPNFRRFLERGGLVERTGQFNYETGGRPAELFQFRREVLSERPAPGVGLPGLSASVSH